MKGKRGSASFVLTAAACFISYHDVTAQTARVGGQLLSCSNLGGLSNLVMGHPAGEWVPGWQDYDYDAASDLIRECDPINLWHRSLLKRLAQMQAAQFQDEIDRQRKEAELKHQQEVQREAEQEAERQRDLAAQNDSVTRLEERRDRENRCHQSREYAAFEAQEAVIADRENIARAQRIIDRQHQIRAVSGVEDLQALYLAGAMIASARTDMQSQWGAYRKAGGRAELPGNVRHDLPDPCADIEAQPVSQGDRP
ncbi:MAG: hypothetical protein KGL39_15510 [Patescibacteria group bacterium]|nr:hypothetical protein [Patescibacteria group bacterium]